MEIPSFADWLKVRRKEQDLSRQELARRVGCSVELLRKLEVGRRRPSKQVAERLAACLEIAPDQHEAFIQAARSTPLPERQPASAQPALRMPRESRPLGAPLRASSVQHVESQASSHEPALDHTSEYRPDAINDHDVLALPNQPPPDQTLTAQPRQRPRSARPTYPRLIVLLLLTGCVVWILISAPAFSTGAEKRFSDPQSMKSRADLAAILEASSFPTPAPPPPTLAPLLSPNLLVNDDFSSGSILWTSSGRVGIDSCCAYRNGGFPGGSYPHALARPDGAGGSIGLWQSIADVQAGIYRLGGWIRTSDDQQWGLIQADNGDPARFPPYCKTPLTKSSSWQYFSCTFTLAGPDILHVALVASNEPAAAEGWVAWDSITLYRRTAPNGYLEEPAEGTTVDGRVRVRGWAKVDRSTIDRIEIWIDGVERGAATYSYARPDAGGDYGFDWYWDTADEQNGSHTIAIKAIGTNGTSAWLPSSVDPHVPVQVIVAHPLTPTRASSLP